MTITKRTSQAVDIIRRTLDNKIALTAKARKGTWFRVYGFREVNGQWEALHANGTWYIVRSFTRV